MPEDNELKCCDETLEFKLQEGQSWQTYIPETASCKKCNSYYERKPGKDIAYKQTEDGYLCTKCGEEIAVGRVAHTLHDMPFPLSGSGKVQNEYVSYCPNCEEKPEFHGAPINN